MDYSDKFVVIGRNDEGHIVTVVNVVGGNYGEIEKAANETAEKTHLKYEILHDNTLFDVVYHFEQINQIILDNIKALYNHTFLLNKAIVEDEAEKTNESESTEEVVDDEAEAETVEEVNE